MCFWPACNFTSSVAGVAIQREKYIYPNITKKLTFLKNPTCHLSFALVTGLQKDTESIFKHLHREFSLRILFEVNT